MHSASSWHVARRAVFILVGFIILAYVFGIFEPHIALSLP